MNKALFDAAEAGDRAKVEALILKGADVNAKGEFGQTPLHGAAIWGHKDVAEYLIYKGANVNARENNGKTPLHKAALFVDKEVAELYISKGADVNAKDNSGMTPLHGAAMFGRMVAAEFLIFKGADVSAKDNNGMTPLQLAESKGEINSPRAKQEIIALLQAVLKKQEDDKVAALQKQETEIAALLQSALEKKGGNQREVFNRVLANYKGRPMSDEIRRPFIALAAKLKPAPAIPEEAIKYEGRAQFAFKNAESPADVLSAAKEYEKAVAAAPWVPGYYSDLCTIYEKAKKYAEAKKNCEFFLASSPSAQEASDTSKRIAGLEFAIEKTNSPEAQVARQAESQREKDAVLNRSLDGAVFVKRKTFDYGTAEWELRINAGEVTYSYEIIALASDSTVPANVRGTWRQILMNSGYSGEKMLIASGRLVGNQFRLMSRVNNNFGSSSYSL